MENPVPFHNIPLPRGTIKVLEMGDDGLKSTLRSMRDDWDRRARENARYYVATGQADWSDEEFLASGEREVAGQVLNDMGNICQGRDPSSMRVLEIGCGMGRVTRALARIFGEVHGVDVSGEMIALARAALASQPNAFVYQNNGMDLSVVPDVGFDFAFSVIVFQHIPSRQVIENYFREVARLLRPGALFKVQVQGGGPAIPECPPAPVQEAPQAEPAPESQAPLPLRWRLTGKIPLPIRKRFLRPIRRLMLPKPAALPPPPPPPAPIGEPDTWVGVMFTADEAKSLSEACGYELRYQRGSNEQEYWLWCFKK
jgi:SAM-dependent methyltransferase